MVIDGPTPIHLGDHRRLGPDPEPLGERFEVLMGREHATHFGGSRAPTARRPAQRIDGPAVRRRAHRDPRDLALR